MAHPFQRTWPSLQPLTGPGVADADATVPPGTPIEPAEVEHATGVDTLFPLETLPERTLPRADGPMRQVGRYQIRHRLGRGGMATVYRAHDPSIGRDVAIKFLHAALCEDEECRTRFLREARAAGALSHANIVTVHDVGEIEGRPFMAMELIDGTPLAEVLERQPMLPLRDIVLIGLQLARALDYAHARGIVHRDIKPGNILLLRDGHTIKVTDFGIAHIDDGAAAPNEPPPGAVIGTPNYMSPEQARGERLDGRSDLFCTGIVLYQLLAGVRPFQADTLAQVAQQIAQVEPPPLTNRRPDAPAALRRIVERCLRKDPAERFASGGELAGALQQVLEAIDATARERARPRIVPLRVKWALTMAAIVALVMGLTAAVIAERQYAAMMKQASDYGAALARFIAAQNAAAVQAENWPLVEAAVQEIMRTRDFERIAVIDSAGIVRVSSVPVDVGQSYRASPGRTLGPAAGGVKVTRHASTAGTVLGFDAPVNLRDRQIGRVALGIAERPLAEVARLSIALMILLALVTVAAVALATLLLAKGFARPVRLVVESMGEIAMGRYAHRIGETRSDEFGALYTAFDDMAQALHRRASTPSGAQAPSAEAPPDRPG